ncbi:MAG: hypothetical protein PHS59_06755 [Paludibacter sp.]|nr:hypothetical protein [Paludibacter sp.]
MYDEEKDLYKELYLENKLTKNEIRQFKQFENLPDKEIEKISDLIFDLAVLANRIISE